MTRIFPLAVVALAACNPAVVDAPDTANRAAENPRAPAPRENAVEPAGEEPEFSARGTVRCVTRARWAVRECAAGVMRARGGGAVVTVFHPEGRSRDILFDSAGHATGVRTAEADGSDRQGFSARRSGAATMVTLGPERYEIPDRLLEGD